MHLTRTAIGDLISFMYSQFPLNALLRVLPDSLLTSDFPYDSMLFD